MMKFSNKGRRSARAGFSLIEILIATSILLVIVVLASLVFQQMTGAYQAGERKMDSQVILRNVIGSITRDLALAVDSTEYPGLDVNNISDGSSITFLALTGTPGGDEGTNGQQGGGQVRRTAQVISYKFNAKKVTREEQSTACAKGKWSRVGETRKADLNDDEHPIEEFEFIVDGDDLVPDRVYIRAEIEKTHGIASVGVGSRGRNRQFESGDGKSDDIWVGLNPNHAP